MADVEFSNYVEGLTSAGTPDGTEIVPVSQAGAAKRTTVQAIANKASIPASQISDSTSTGRSVLTAADASAARTAIGAGTSSFSGAYADLSGKPTLGTAAALDVAASGDAASGEVVKGNDSRLSDSRAPTSAGLAATITGATSKTTPVDADEVPLADSAASYGLKKLTWANIKATAKAYFDTLYAAVSHTHAASDITSGTMATARLGSGTADSTTYLRGDQTWATVSSGGGTPGGSGTELQYRSGASTFGAVTGSSVDGASLTLGGDVTVGSSFTLNLLSGLLKANATSAVTAAVAETDYVTPSGSGTLTNKTLAGVTVSGNLTFSGTSRLITGDFTNATASSRAGVQTSTSNSTTAFDAMPSGTGTAAYLTAFNASDRDNAGYIYISANSTEARIATSKSGTASNIPLKIIVGGTERASIGTDGVSVWGDYAMTRAMMKDTGWSYYDSNTTSALDFTNGSHQRWAPSGTVTLSVTNWAPSGNLSELLIEGVNLGAATITWPTVNWIKSDGTTTTTFSNAGVTLQTSGVDWVLLWTRDAGTTIYGKVVR